MYALKQNKIPISDYYVQMTGIWEEVNAMSELVIVTVMSSDITAFLNALHNQ